MNSYVNHLTDSNIWPVLPQGTPYSWQTAANPTSQMISHQPSQPAAPSPPPRRIGSHMNEHQSTYSAPPPLLQAISQCPYVATSLQLYLPTSLHVYSLHASQYSRYNYNGHFEDYCNAL